MVGNAAVPPLKGGSCWIGHAEQPDSAGARPAGSAGRRRRTIGVAVGSGSGDLRSESASLLILPYNA
eukprot:7078505-Prymnesium_polylepis.1